MKKKMISMAVIGVVAAAMMACSSGTDLGTKQPTTESERESEALIQTETTKQVQEVSLGILGAQETSMKQGTTSDLLSSEGFYYEDADYKLRVDASYQLLIDAGDGEQVIASQVYGGINCYEQRIYYIACDTNYIHSICADGSDDKLELESPAYELFVCEQGIVYTDKQSQLYVQSWKQETEQISKTQCLWLNVYGEWLIYTQLEGNGKNPVMAYNLSDGESIKLLEYGFSPSIYEDTMYYQGADGGVYVYDLVSGDSQLAADTWGQNFVKIQDQLYFTNADEIYCMNISDGAITTVYVSDGGVLHQLWRCGDALEFSEVINKTTIHKQYVPGTQVSDYE